MHLARNETFGMVKTVAFNYIILCVCDRNPVAGNSHAECTKSIMAAWHDK